MFGLGFWILSLIGLAYIFLGALVIVRNPRGLVNRTFLALVIAITIWIATNIVYQLVSDNYAYPVALLSYSAAGLIGVFVLQFCLLITNHKFNKLLMWGGVIFSLLAMIPGFLATGVHNHAIQTTPFLLGYAIFLLGHFGATVVVLFQHKKHAYGLERRRTDIILYGLGSAFIGGSFFNLILPLTGNYSLVQFGPVASTLIVGSMALAIIRHKLFDIRTFVIRAATYSLLVLLLGAFYVVTVLNFGGNLLFNAGLQDYEKPFYALMTFVVAVSFRPLKQFFDRTTNRIFFQDAYSTQDVLDRLSSLIVGTIDLNNLVKGSTKILADAIRPKSIQILLLDKEGKTHFHTTNNGRKSDMSELLKLLQAVDSPVVVRDELHHDHAPTTHLHKALDQMEAALVIRLQTSKDLVGYLVFAHKQSGNMYNTKDVNVIRIAADELAIAIQNALRFQEIQDFNKTLQEKVDTATAELRGSNAKLQQLDAAKDEFISMASHQLRTPLTTVKGYLSMVLEGDAGELSKMQRKLLDEAYASSQRMVGLINDFLNVSRLKTGKFLLELSSVVMPQLISEEIDRLQATAEGRDLKIKYDPPARFPALRLDENKIRQVIMNFIDNAIYYSRPGGVITIELTHTGKEVVFKVKDQGIGVPAGERHHLFSKFYRASNARKARPDGTGIGLFMAKKVVVTHGGSIIFETAENKGSTFGFRLPVHGAKE